jgi:hypothetical protein
VGLIIGFALLGSVTYLPLFLQIVKGLSPTASGLRMVPLMGGTLLTSILAGQIVSRTGRYKIFPRHDDGDTVVVLDLTNDDGHKYLHCVALDRVARQLID